MDTTFPNNAFWGHSAMPTSGYGRIAYAAIMQSKDWTCASVNWALALLTQLRRGQALKPRQSGRGRLDGRLGLWFFGSCGRGEYFASGNRSLEREETASARQW